MRACIERRETKTVTQIYLRTCGWNLRAVFLHLGKTFSLVRAMWLLCDWYCNPFISSTLNFLCRPSNWNHCFVYLILRLWFKKHPERAGGLSACYSVLWGGLSLSCRLFISTVSEYVMKLPWRKTPLTWKLLLFELEGMQMNMLIEITLENSQIRLLLYKYSRWVVCSCLKILLHSLISPRCPFSKLTAAFHNL